jgi:hypothetical protein
MQDTLLNETDQGTAAPSIAPTSDEFTATLARAFDIAWDRIREVEGTSADTPENRKRLAGRIVQMARAGEMDETVLAEAGVIYMCVLAEAVRLGARNRSEPESTDAALPPGQSVSAPQGAHAFSPDTVAAMSEALDRCIDALPLHAPSAVLQFLTNSILEEASRGERDPEKLRIHALEALKNR